MLDVSASYPWGEACLNISKKTTHLELIDIEGISEHVRRMQGINLSAGATNAVEFCTALFGLPTPVEWEEAFLADRAAGLLANGVQSVGFEVPVTPFAFQNATRTFDDFYNDDLHNEVVEGEELEEEALED